VTKKPPALPIWSARIGDLPAAGRTLEIDATPAERRAIAAAYGVKDIESFQARLTLQPRADGGARLSGRLKARLTQTCVVSLRPVAAVIDEEFTRTFLPAARIEPMEPERRGGRKARAELVFDLEDEPPEPLHGEAIDLAAVLLEEFALALDPYPRHPEAILEGATEAGDRRREDSPFAVLRDARRGKSE
jgi:uncharacterized metal-binding protein YceD (DUF177 family)